MRTNVRVRILEVKNQNAYPGYWFVIEYLKGKDRWAWVATISDVQLQAKIDLLQEALDSLDRGFRELRSFKIGPKRYFIDERLMQLRNVENASEFVDLR